MYEQDSILALSTDRASLFRKAEHNGIMHA